jgi:hypothetical protein
MNVKCLLGSHRWASCQCSACGKTRDVGHDLKKDCENCARCSTFVGKRHDWEERESGLSICRLCRKWEVSREYAISRDYEGYTPLHHVAQDGNDRLAEALLAAGAEVDAVTPGGNTPLCMAAAAARNSEWGGVHQLDVAKVLLEHGANITKVQHESCRRYLLRHFTLH